MRKLDILNTRQAKPMLRYIKERWSVDLKGYVFLMNPKKNVYISTHDLDRIALTKLNINLIGYYCFEWKRDQARLSIEGSQLVGPHATKNVVELNQGLFTLWMAGHDLEYPYEDRGYVILKHQEDFVGCGYATGEKILNYVPKARRVFPD